LGGSKAEGKRLLRYKEKEDIEARYSQVDEAVDNWRTIRKAVPEALRREFAARLRISLVYHDAALEGEVLTHSEIKAAIDPTIISDTSLIPAYDQIKAYDDACNHALEIAGGRRKLKLDVIREIAEKLNTEDASQAQYRKDNPLHRLYYHEISPPEKISYRMRKFGEWLDSRTTQAMHPVERAAHTHHKLMRIFPWAKLSGKTARIVANLLLVQEDYPIAVIHSIDRQRYYEALKQDGDQIVLLYLESIETTAVSECQVYDEALRSPRRRRRA
jgi:Fic family protein